MLTKEFDFILPKELVANYPVTNRVDSRLLTMDNNNKNNNKFNNNKFSDIIDFLNPGDLLVVNNSKVMPARLFGHKASGGKVEILIVRIINKFDALVYIKSSKAIKINQIIYLNNNLNNNLNSGYTAKILDKLLDKQIESENILYKINFQNIEILELLKSNGEMPLPPYISRSVEISDKKRYQTVYAETLGSIAAPTAGLHFDEKLLAKISAKGINIASLVLHVGIGTFKPVRAEKISEHKMHAEYINVNKKLCDLISITKANNKRVIAVGTTTIRALETAASSGVLKPFAGETNIFITPGFKFQVIDSLITNFHVPKSSLLMLVCAFAGKDLIFSAYQHAIENKYRFYSYGDAMLLNRA